MTCYVVLLAAHTRLTLNHVDVNQKNHEENSDVKDDESDDDEVGDGIVEHLSHLCFTTGEYRQIIIKPVIRTT